MKRPENRSCRMLRSRPVSTMPCVGFPGSSCFQPPRVRSAVVSIFVLYRDPLIENPPLHTSPPQIGKRRRLFMPVSADKIAQLERGLALHMARLHKEEKAEA